MPNFTPRSLTPLLLLVGLWTTEAAAQRAGERPPKAPQITLSAVSEPSSDSLATAPSSNSGECRLKVRSQQVRGWRDFSATAILDLDFRLRFDPAQVAAQTVRIEIHTPSSHLFQILTVPFTDEQSEAGTRRNVAGFPRPMKVQLTRQTSGRNRNLKEVVGRLPVAGTSIVQSSLYGRWTAKAYFGEELEPCGRARAFFIRP